MFCEQCGAKLPEGAKFCAGCGAKTERVQVAYTASAEPAPPRPGAYSGQPGSEPLRVGQYIGMLLLMIVPILSVVLLFVWSFGGSVNLNKKNFARAMLIVSAIGIVLSIIFSTALIGIVGELFGGYY
ncbi:MAG: zinc ribbon domain-containing protein [Oscillospiraceae bacterium]|nr:zinc ribbon domain-containing protein [Oscillospiraceae bacterium]